MTTKIKKVFIPAILVYGNNNVCLGVCIMVFIHIVIFKNYFKYEKRVFESLYAH